MASGHNGLAHPLPMPLCRRSKPGRWVTLRVSCDLRLGSSRFIASVAGEGVDLVGSDGE